MALVAYSDSEGSDSEAPSAPKTKITTHKSSEATAFQKVEPRKIKVDLPAVKAATHDEQTDDRPAKRARTNRAFGGFNSLLPAPKRPAAQNAVGRGVSLKTSADAAFSRRPVAQNDEVAAELNGTSGDAGEIVAKTTVSTTTDAPPEPKIVGKATKFKPLSVQAGKKKKKPALVSTSQQDASNGTTAQQPAVAARNDTTLQEATPQPAAKAKRSLFSVPQGNNEEAAPSARADTYESIIATEPSIDHNSSSDQPQQQPQTSQHVSNPNSLDSLASSLNLTPAQRRQLFGRKGKDGEVNIAHFNMDAEYASNEQLRQAGEVFEHKAVKSIAPGKHSLQQLVNNARSQQENLEDKWADGRRERGDAGSKYGWGR